MPPTPDISLEPSSAQPGADEVDLILAAIDRVEQGGTSRSLSRMLDRALDGEGVPHRWPVTRWWDVLDALARARSSSAEEWSEALEARIEALFRVALRFSRPGGASFFGAATVPKARPETLAFWAHRLSDPTLAGVVDRWYPSRARGGVLGSPFLPAFACGDRPLAVLRPDWNARGDWIGVAPGSAGAPAALELAGAGTAWIGPDWQGPPPTGRIKPVRWRTEPFADLFEWSYPIAGAKVVRSALLLRNRDLAILAEQREGGGEAEYRLGLAPGVAASAAPDGRGVALEGPRRASARVLPIALPGRAAGLSAGPEGIALRQAIAGRRAWLPLLFSWDAARNRKPTQWRVLTVAEKSKACPADVAFAARVWWGQSGSLVVYRSLAAPASRCFLGYQTSARLRYLVGEFTEEGLIRPWIKVEE